MKITREEGFYGYFKGNGTNIVRIVPYSAAQFYAYEKYKLLAVSLSGNKELTTIERLIAGAMSGVTSTIITYPLDLIRSRLTVQNDYVRYSGIADAFRKIVSSEGFFALYRGMMPTLMGIAPYVGINFTTYETLKQFLCKNPSKPTSTESLSYGGISGAVAQTVTYPIDLIRRRMQIQGFASNLQEYNNSFDVIKKNLYTIWVKRFLQRHAFLLFKSYTIYCDFILDF